MAETIGEIKYKMSVDGTKEALASTGKKIVS